MKYFSFVEEAKTPGLDTNFEDLARLLAKNPELRLERALFSFCDTNKQAITISSFWDDYSPLDRSLCIKSDIYLRTLGSLQDTDWKAVRIFMAEPWQLPGLAKNLFSLCEDIRLEHQIKRDRKGTERAFKRRREILGSYCKAQLPSQMLQSAVSDTFLLMAMASLLNCDLQGTIHTAHALTGKLVPIVRLITEISGQTLTIPQYVEIEEQLGELTSKDLITNLFTMVVDSNLHVKANHTFDKLTREKKIENLDTIQDQNQKPSAPSEKQDAWHRETKQNHSALLQMKLEHGANSGQQANEARITEETPESISVMKGKSQEQERESNPESVMKGDLPLETSGHIVSNHPKTNLRIPCVVVHTPPITPEAIATYRLWLETLAPVQKQLVRVINRYIAFKQTNPGTWRSMGRIGKSLVHLATDKEPKIFYKPNQPSQEKDAAFYLLVDCSGSMYDKLEQVKQVVALCHETFTELQIPHAVSGFWEESTDGVHNQSTMYMQEAIPFEMCFNPASGFNITGLEPQLDNRDGYAIRQIANYLIRRNEQHRFLLVFSDGDPAADGYTSYGIADTVRAVKWATQRNIHVLHFFISNTPAASSTILALREMYGKNNILVDNPESLVKQTEAVLRRLLYRVL